MNWVFVATGFVFGFLTVGNLLVVVFHDLPYAHQLSKTHGPARAQRIDGKLDLLNGPVPYGRIFLGSVIFTIVLIVVSLILFFAAQHYLKMFGMGVGIASVACIFGLYDPNERFKRDFHLKYGDNYMSKLDQAGIYNLQDEQEYIDSTKL